MSLIRFSLDLAIPKTVYDALPLAKKIAARDIIRELKALAVRVNEGQPNEEMTVMAKMHVCNHDSGQPCEPEVDI